MLMARIDGTPVCYVLAKTGVLTPTPRFRPPVHCIIYTRTLYMTKKRTNQIPIFGERSPVNPTSLPDLLRRIKISTVEAFESRLRIGS
jgi:hypothetical protein